MKHVKLFEQFIGESVYANKIELALNKIEKWMPEDLSLIHI